MTETDGPFLFICCQHCCNWLFCQDWTESVKKIGPLNFTCAVLMLSGYERAEVS